jgi:uncharacterized protein (TIGR01777 family)
LNFKKAETVLISGGSGLVGTELSELLQNKGFCVIHLTRSLNSKSNYQTSYWNPKQGVIDEGIIEKTHYIIHLAGAGIADKHWSDSRKIEILDSRVKTAELLFETVKRVNPNLKAFISASGVGYYGATTSDNIFSEEDPNATDFLGETCKKWEDAADLFSNLNSRVVKLRTGLVISKTGGAIKKMSLPIKLGIGSALGSGKHYMPWIDISDLAKLYVEAIENELYTGTYNAVSSEHQTNEQFTKTLAKQLNKPLFLPKVPAFLLRLVFGELSTIALEGSRVSNQKLISSNFKFNFPTLESSLKSI